MDIGSIFLILAVALLVIWYVVRPFIDGKSSLVTKEAQEMSHLLAEQDRVLTALQELEFDYQLGKIPAEDYPVQRELMMHHGAQTLRQMDALRIQGVGAEVPASKAVAPAAGLAVSPEDRIEAAVAARRMVARGLADRPAQPERLAPITTAQPDDDLEVLMAERRRARAGKSAGFCHKCGGALQNTDRFCPKCGTPCAALN